ncbi:MAG TPA: NAD(P)/FAD-dependent oxidoreductase [Minicystis sp.]|nr:NAD(P)/FAD-dependent oxidoreductase [Minicystis sp.]
MDVDLAIVGGGPSGVATALFFAAAAPGRVDRVVVLEKERYPREKICAGAIGKRADRALEEIGVHVDVPSAIVSGLSVAGAERALKELLDEPIGRVVRRVEFDAALAGAAKARGVRVVEGARVTALERTAHGVTLETTAGEIRANAVVGADGVGSFVRRALGLPRGRFTAQVVEVDTEAVAGDVARPYLHFDVTDRSYTGYAWDFPTIVAGRELVCRGVYELRDEQHALTTPEGAAHVDVGERLTRRLEAQGATVVGKVKRFAERGLAPHEAVARPRALLVGEAAGIDPVLGEGIAQAILYGKVAGAYLARAASRKDWSFYDWPDELRRSRVGWDLAVRARAAQLAYGPTRAPFERWVTSSRHLAVAGMRYFAGDPVPRGRTLAAVAGLGVALAGALTSPRPAASS